MGRGHGRRQEGRPGREVYHDIGDRVKPGELLVECEREDAELAVSQAEKHLLADLAKLGMNMMTVPKDLPDLGKIDINALPNVVEAAVALDRTRNNLTRERNLMGKGCRDHAGPAEQRERRPVRGSPPRQLRS